MTTHWHFLSKLMNHERVQARDPEPATGWTVLAFSAVEERLAVPFTQEPERICGFRKNDWQTIVCNGSDAQRFDGLVSYLGGRLYRLETSVVSKIKAHRCREGRFCCRYRMELLNAKPVSGGKTKCLWRSPESRFLDFCKCSLVPDTDQHVDSEECSAFTIKSIVDDTISIDEMTDEFDIASARPHGGRAWKTLKLTNGGLKELRISRQIVQQADKTFAELCAHDTWAQDYDPSYFTNRGFLVMPGKEGLAVDFQCGYRPDPFDGSAYRFRLERPHGLSEPGERARINFKRRHPQLANWDEIDSYTVAPDQSAFVFVSKGHLFWGDVTGKQLTLGPIDKFGGWQWVRTEQLAEPDQRWLDQHKPACAAIAS